MYRTSRARSTGIRSEYVQKVKRIDQIFAPNVVGNGNDGISGPCHSRMPTNTCTFCRGGVIPLVIGAYGETNEDFQEVLKFCARTAVARGDAVYNSPIFETEVKGGAYSVTLHVHLYRRALAGAIARGLSLHKRSRLHFVRGSRVEAARVAEEARNHLRLACALIVTDSRLVIRVENMVTTSSLEVLGVDLSGAMSE